MPSLGIVSLLDCTLKMPQENSDVNSVLGLRFDLPHCGSILDINEHVSLFNRHYFFFEEKGISGIIYLFFIYFSYFNMVYYLFLFFY